MNEPVYRFRYQITESDYVSISRSILWELAKGWLIKGIAGFAIVTLLIAVRVFSGAAQTKFWSEATSIGFALSVGCLAVACIAMLNGLAARKLYREQASLALETEAILTKAGIEIRNPKGDLRLEWRDLLQWNKTPSHMALYVNRALITPLPLSALGDAGTMFVVERLTESGLPKAGTRRKF